MKSKITISSSLSLALCLGLAFSGSGCGGGASSDPTVTARPKRAPQTVEKGNGKANGGAPQNQNGGDPGKPGTFAGTVTFDGTPPKVGQPDSFDPGGAKTDKYCVANKDGVKDLTLVVDPQSKGVKNVFVYLPRKPPGVTIPPAPTEPVEFDQKNCTFLPHALVMRTNQPVLVKNSDQTSHNAHTNPLNAASNAYNKSMSGGQTDQYTYAGAERLPVKVVCDIHGWMSAYQLPLDHPFVALTDKDGKFSIGGLPPGDYTFRIWHEKAGYLEREFNVFIDGGQTTEESFTYPASKFASLNGPAPKTVVVSANK